MNKSLLEQLPEIVRNGKRRAEQILESLEGKTRVGLQTRELVMPARDSKSKEFAAVKAVVGRDGPPGRPTENDSGAPGGRALPGNRDPLALIEYWSVDPDYDGEIFRSVWQDYRGNTENDDDPLHVVMKAVLSGLPVKDGKRRVCVRVVDVFGFEAEVVKEV